MFLKIEYRFLFGRDLPYIVFLSEDRMETGVFGTYSLWTNELRFSNNGNYYQEQIISYLESIMIKKPDIINPKDYARN